MIVVVWKPKHQQTVPILSEDVFTILGDKQSIEILESASAGMRSSSNGIRNQSKKQYYVRLKRLVEMGIVEKRKAIYNLTAFGLLVYENHFKTMKKVIPNYWQIKNIDVLRTRNDFPLEQKEKIIKEYLATSSLNGILNTTHLTRGFYRCEEVR